ncbi:MAG: response regulator [Bacteroidota bacterium]
MEEELRLLIIDDDEVDRMAIRRSVRKAGILASMDDADSIQAAWEHVRANAYDCVFLDYRLPGGDGLEVLQEFRKEGYKMPVIVVTSQGDEKIAVEVMKSGGSDYISKRLVNPEGISQILRNAIRTHHAEVERQHTAAALRISEARLAEAQRIAKIGSWELDMVTGVRYWSEQVYLMVGYENPSQQAVNIDLFVNHIHPEDLPSSEDYVRRCLRDDEDFRFDMRIVTVTQEVRHVEIQGRSIRNAQDRAIKIVGTIQDINERKQIERELIEARDIAERSAKSREEFLANMSHEIRTPMNAIIGFTKLLYDSPLNAEQRDSLTAIDAAGEALIAIINDILDLSKIEAGMLRFEPRPFDLEELLQSLRGIFRARANEKNLFLEVFIGPDVPRRIVGDRVRLNQVLINLVGNAIKFTETGEVSISVKQISGSDARAHLLFEVADTGIGIAPEKRVSIFESFTQASNETTRKYGGTGLGLTICKRIVELQGGKIGVQSTLGEGSNFYFDLEFAVAEEAVSTPTEKAAPTAQRVVPQHIRVLLAEDNLMNQKLAGRVLERLGYRYEIAANGREALAMLIAQPFDVVLMDIQMPEMDGYEATRRIRAHAETRVRRTPVIALTAHAMAEEVDRCLAAGMNAFISKPFHPDTLRDKIVEWVGGGGPVEIAPKKEIKAAEAAGRSYVDLSALDALAAGSDAFKAELIAIFLEEAPAALQRMQSSLVGKDGEAIYQAMHGLKPSLVMFKIPGHADLVPEVERVARTESPDFGRLRELLGRLAPGLEGAIAELQAEL